MESGGQKLVGANWQATVARGGGGVWPIIVVGDGGQKLANDGGEVWPITVVGDGGQKLAAVARGGGCMFVDNRRQ